MYSLSRPRGAATPQVRRVSVICSSETFPRTLAVKSRDLAQNISFSAEVKLVRDEDYFSFLAQWSKFYFFFGGGGHTHTEKKGNLIQG